MTELFLTHGTQFDKVATPIAKPAQLLPLPSVVHEEQRLKYELKEKHRESEEDEEEEDACARASWPCVHTQ